MAEQLEREHGSVLAVGLPPSDLSDAPPACTVADSARGAIELLRILRFDLVVTSDRLSDMPVWQFVKRIRSAWPWQKWALISKQLTEHDEITARTLGVMQIIEGAVDWDAVSHLATTLHRQYTHSALVSSGDSQLLRVANSTG